MSTIQASHIEQIADPRQVDPRFVGHAVLAHEVPEGLFAKVEPGENLRIPDYLQGDGPFVVPSLTVVTPRNGQGVSREGRLVNLFPAYPPLARLYENAARTSSRLTEMSHTQALRILTNVGANGLHHVRGTAFPNTVFFPVNRGAHPYMTQVGLTINDAGDKVPVLAVLGATNGPKAEREFHNSIRLGQPKKR